MTRKQRRLTMIGGSLAVLAIAAALVLNALRDSIVFFSTPVMVAEKHIQPGQRFRLGGLVLPFIGMALWTLVPDRIEEGEASIATRMGVFGATLATFFLAEMGDKTQIATIALSAHYGSALLVVIGTTLGMLIADLPAMFVGDRLAARIPMRLVRTVAAGIFLLLGLSTLWAPVAMLKT